MNLAQNSLSPQHVYDVLIVGAGPVGLATAIGLYKRGIDNILVIDQTHSFRKVGQAVDLLPNGLKALKYIDKLAYQNIIEKTGHSLHLQSSNTSDAINHQLKEKKTPQVKAWNYKNLQGKIIHSIPLDFATWFNRYGGGRVSIHWFDLQTTLRNLLPPEIIQTNHRCIEVTDNAESVQITSISDSVVATNPFGHWEMQATKDFSSQQNPCTQKLRAKLLVAADGINSTIRQVLYRNSELSQWAKPKYSGFAAIGCLEIDDVPDEIIQELEDQYFQGDRVVTLRHDTIESNSQDLGPLRLILIRRQGKTLGYLLHCQVNLETILNQSPKASIQLAARVLENADFPSIFINLVNLTPTEKLIHRPYYIHPANIPSDARPIWSSGRVVLVGDAAHGMPPFAAQGANQGFEDAALISTLVTKIMNNNALDDINMIIHEFCKYEQIRRSFMIKIQEATMTSHNWSQEEWDDFGDMVYLRDLEQSMNHLVSV